jgi:heptosyltransferase-2
MSGKKRPVVEGFGSYAPECRHFSGYRPCRFRRPCDGCPHYADRGTRILLVNLDAMGAVLRATSLLVALRRAFPRSHVTWLTRPNAAPLLEHNPYIDEVIVFGPETSLELEPRRFDVVLNADKGRVSAALALRVAAGERRGFGVDGDGSIVPLTPAAGYQYWTGLDDDLKFRRNRKTEQEMLAETFGLEYRRDPYVLALSEAERGFVEERRRAWGLEGTVVVGLNTGCSAGFPNKKLPVDYQLSLLEALAARFPEAKVLLLGGREDAERNAELARRSRVPVLATPCGEGVRRGLQYVALTDVVVTGDSLGMHMAIALGKRVVAWFGLTCAHEIDFYDRGEAVLSKAECGPCWRSECGEEVKCNERVDQGEILDAVGRMLEGVRREGRLE